MKFIQNHITQIKALCKSNGVNSLFAFGSVTTDLFEENSDIDLIVDIQDSDPITYSEKYFNLKFKLQDLLQRNIDLLEEKTIKNKYLRNEINETKVLVYGN